MTDLVKIWHAHEEPSPHLSIITASLSSPIGRWKYWILKLKMVEVCHSDTNYTHLFNDPLSRTTRVSRSQKGKTNLDFTEARDSEWQWHQLGHIKSAPRSRGITMRTPDHSVFYRPDALPATQPTASKHWRHSDANQLVSNISKF